MSDEKNKGEHHDQETINPVNDKKDELGEKDLDKAAGGNIGHEKWIELDSV